MGWLSRRESESELVQKLLIVLARYF